MGDGNERVAYFIGFLIILVVDIILIFTKNNIPHDYTIPIAVVSVLFLILPIIIDEYSKLYYIVIGFSFLFKILGLIVGGLFLLILAMGNKKEEKGKK